MHRLAIEKRHNVEGGGHGEFNRRSLKVVRHRWPGGARENGWSVLGGTSRIQVHRTVIRDDRFIERCLPALTCDSRS